jgi:hypothetical protein
MDKMRSQAILPETQARVLNSRLGTELKSILWFAISVGASEEGSGPDVIHRSGSTTSSLVQKIRKGITRLSRRKVMLLC